jgi:hypothetical protein
MCEQRNRARKGTQEHRSRLFIQNAEREEIVHRGRKKSEEEEDEEAEAYLLLRCMAMAMAMVLFR